jgi:ATP adenylyltransferase
MVAPYAHAGDLTELDSEALSDMMRLAQRVMRALQSVYQPHGFNVGFNLGEAAGAGIAEHLHLHIVPRWRGDTNFMSVNADVRVLPEDLGETCAKLRKALEAHGG